MHVLQGSHASRAAGRAHLHLQHSFHPSGRPEAMTAGSNLLPSARARERLAKVGSVVLDAIFDEDHDGEVAESSFSSRPAAPRIR